MPLALGSPRGRFTMTLQAAAAGPAGLGPGRQRRRAAVAAPAAAAGPALMVPKAPLMVRGRARDHGQGSWAWWAHCQVDDAILRALAGAAGLSWLLMPGAAGALRQGPRTCSCRAPRAWEPGSGPGRSSRAASPRTWTSPAWSPGGQGVSAWLASCR